MEVAAADDETAFAIEELLAARCAIAPADRATREPDGARPVAAVLPGPSPGRRR
ncbi:DUF6207 family protein [Streptomyces sp. NPDC004749]